MTGATMNRTQEITPENWRATITPILQAYPKLAYDGLHFGRPQAPRFNLFYEESNIKNCENFNTALRYLRPFSKHWNQPEDLSLFVKAVRDVTEKKHLPEGIIIAAAVYIGADVQRYDCRPFIRILPHGYKPPLPPQSDPNCAKCSGTGRKTVQQGFYTLNLSCLCVGEKGGENDDAPPI